MNCQISNRTRQRHFHIELNPAAVVALTSKNDELISAYAQAYVRGANDHCTLREYVDQVALDMKGLAAIPEIKRQLRNAIRKLETQQGVY